MGKKLLNTMLAWLSSVSSNTANRIELEAATSGRGLVGAYAWAKHDFEYRDIGVAQKLQVQFAEYLSELFPDLSPSVVASWLREQSLSHPGELASLDCGSLFELAKQETVSILADYSLRSSLLRRRSQKYQNLLGKAFLLDPALKVSWPGVLLV